MAAFKMNYFKKKYFCLFFCLNFIVWVESAFEIVINDDGSEFSVYLNSILLLQHSPLSSLVTLGTGTFEAKHNLGNFDINDTVTSMISLDAFSIGNFF